MTVTNKTGSEITIETRPELRRVKQTTLADSSGTLLPNKKHTLLPDSSLSLLRKFTGLVLHRKISERDLPIDYLRIETKTDTLIADNRTEIVKLIKDPRLKFQMMDKTYALDNNKNIEAIIVRQ